ncbi:class I glutamine amidotransferase-like protein [Stachybotrys elegans]|uniref:Class I glutamine amidotransferase-like protein n=1 Tax=Stachybotrys elegans TaxID=80388 RepID=A0A8K0WMH7_9HYPO|nr:class I glutamine amidotransferase-like protein [Stachybotrys elegans]
MERGGKGQHSLLVQMMLDRGKNKQARLSVGRGWEEGRLGIDTSSHRIDQPHRAASSIAMTSLRIAMLNADTPVEAVRVKHPTYGHVFQHLLGLAATRIAPLTYIESEDFDVVQGQYPEFVDNFDAILITGSAASSYDDNEWNHKLDAWLADVYQKHPSVKIFGSCFGHQMVCQSLLRPHGVYVEKAPNGWELGVRKVTFTDQFRSAFAKRTAPRLTLPLGMRPPTPDADHDAKPVGCSVPEAVQIQLVHADHVKIPSGALPDSWMVIGSSAHCPVQGVYEPGRVLTYQGHFEFDRFINAETVKVFGARWEPQMFQAALNAIDADDDAEVAAEMVLRFFLEGRGGDSGMVTPP